MFDKVNVAWDVANIVCSAPPPFALTCTLPVLRFDMTNLRPTDRVVAFGKTTVWVVVPVNCVVIGDETVSVVVPAAVAID